MRVLLVGSGGREHALGWAIAKSPMVDELLSVPGNPGLAGLGRCLAAPSDGPWGLVEMARRENSDLVVVGPEAPLAAGLADRLADAGIPCFGPRAGGARLEASKAFANAFCTRRGIPTAKHAAVRSMDQTREVLDSGRLGDRVVVKASGLAAGKGVFLPRDREGAERQTSRLLAGQLGDAGRTVVLEERLEGPELSVFALTDGRRYRMIGTASDYKRRFDGDRGPNTGGMGSISPGFHADRASLSRIEAEIVAPTVAGLAAEGLDYRGILYAGLMLTARGPKVLEFNVRFGDPEAETLIPRLADDLVPFLLGAAEGRLPKPPRGFPPRLPVP